MILLLLLATIGSFGYVAASSRALGRGPYVVKDSHPVPSQWKRIDRAPKSYTFDLHIGLLQQSYNQLERRLLQISNPDHVDYGKYLNRTQASAMVAPSSDSYKATHNWLAAHGIDNLIHSQAGDWLKIPSISVEDAEKLLDTKYHVYIHQNTGRTIIRTPQYSVPRTMHEHIDVVAPTNYFDGLDSPRDLSMKLQDPKRLRSFSGEPRAPSDKRDTSSLSQRLMDVNTVCNTSAVTVECLRTFYRTIDYVPDPDSGNSIAASLFRGGRPNETDFHLLMSQQREDASLNYTYQLESIAIGISHQDDLPIGLRTGAQIESNLDVLLIGAMVYPTDFIVYSTNASLSQGGGAADPFLDWLQYMSALPDDQLPKTISTSFGGPEQRVPRPYALRACHEFAQLTARGVTLLFASGDTGVGSYFECQDNDCGTTVFSATFPSVCPFVTSVGGTQGFDPEIVGTSPSGFASGAGFSNHFARPWYQQEAVQAYLDSIGDLNAGLYNPSGRAYPDIVAQSVDTQIVYNGQNYSGTGTSAAAPIAASIIALLNDVRIAAGLPPFGFLNPWLYKYGHQGFNDITVGNSPGCDTAGFPAGPGWDVASGWGSPDFVKIANLMVNVSQMGA